MKKRRLLSFMLLMSLIIGVSGTFTSCTDDNDDDGWKEKFETDNRTLTQALQDQINALKTCQSNCQTEQARLQGEIDGLSGKISEVQSGLQGQINGLSGQLGDLKNEMTTALGAKADTAQISALNTEIKNTQTQISNLNDRMTSIQSDLEGKINRGDSLLRVALNAQQAAIDANTGRITANEAAITKLQGDLADAINQNNAAIAEINGKITTINSTLETIQSSINTINTSITNINSRLDGIDGKISTINTTISAIQSDIRTINNNISTLTTNLTNLQNSVTEHFVAYDTKFADLYAKAAADSAAIVQARSIADEADSIAKAAVDSATSVAQEVARVKDLADANSTAIDLLKGRVSTLEELVNKIQDALKKQVTGINVNGTYTPIFGYYAAPTGDFRSTVLGAYYGNPSEFQFPTSTKAYYANTNQTLSSEDLTITGTTPQTLGGSTIVAEDGATGNAGTMYLTLNPTDVDLTGKQFSLVNSQGLISSMNLSGVQPSSETLQFGYTRAGGNGFYETKGTVEPSDVETLKPNVNVADMKDEIRTLYHDWTNRNNGGFRVNLSQLAGVIYENVHDVLPALALKTTWTDDNSSSEHSVLSQYSVGAAAIHPLSFGFLQGRTYTPLPVYTAYEDINVNIDTITVGSLTTPDVRVHVTVKDSNGNDSTYTTTVDGLNELIDQINGQLTGIQSQVNSQIKDVDSEIDRLSKLTNIIKTYDRWANRINGWFSRDGNNNINRSLQPVLFYGSGNEFRKLGNAKYGTAALPSGSSLLATSYTLELLAPAYKKWVAVTNVWPNSNDAVKDINSAQKGNATAKSALQSANSGENMNTVVFGTTRHVTLGTLRHDYVYEISYAAVDFNGKNVVRKFYVRGE